MDSDNKKSSKSVKVPAGHRTEPIYVPYRFLAMLSITAFVFFAMLAWLKSSGNKETDLQVLQQAQAQSTSSAPAAPASSASSAPQAAAKICVFNAGNKTGLAVTTADQLKNYDLAQPAGNYPSTEPGVTVSTVFYAPDQDQQAKKIADTINATAKPRPGDLQVCPGSIVVAVM